MHKQQSLKNKAINGMLWNAIEKFSVQGVQFVIGIILARLLMPEDFGLIGMLAIFMAVSQMFVDSGFSKALIQKQNRTDTDYSTVFFFNLAISIVFYCLLFVFAPLIANFYDAPKLTILTRVLGLTIIINAFTTVQTTVLNIEINFKRLAKLNFVSTLFSGVGGLILAYTGFGVWALVGQSIIRTILYNIVLWYGSKWKPTVVFSMTSFRELFGFGSKLLLAGSVATIVNNMYSILIGKFFSSKEVGYYTRGVQYTDIVSSTVTNILQSVTFPVLTSVQDNRERMIRINKQILRSTAFFVFPLMTLFALLSEPFVRFLLTEKWMPIVPLLQWLCFARLITPISALNLNMLNAMGRSDLSLKIDLFKLPMSLILLLVVVPYGINAVVIGNFIATFIAFFFNTYYPGKILNFGADKQIKEVKSFFFATIGMAITVYLVTQLLEADLLKLILGGITGVISYLAIALIMKFPETMELKYLIINNK